MANQIKFDVGFNVNKSDLNTITSALKNIQNEVNKASVTGNLTDELKRAGTAASQLETILNQAWNSKLGQLDLSRVNNNIKSTYGSVTNLKTALEGSGQAGAAAYNKFASAVLNTNVQLKQGNALVNKMFDSIKNVFTYNISASIFNRLTGTIQEAFNYTKQLDTSLNDIRIVTDKSADSMERFARQANEAAKNMGANTLDYTKASLIYYQQGLSDEEVAARAETTIKAANVTGQTGEEVSEQLTAVWNGYKVSAQETELYVDKLAAVAATTAADLEELSVGMSKVASAANAMGVDFDDLNAQIATIVSVTRQAPESVGTALKTIYARMGDLSVEGGTDEFGVSLGKVSEKMQMMGIQILDQNNNLRDMSSIMAEVAQRWDGWTEAQKQAAAVAMAGKRQYNNLIALFDNWDMYTDALNTSVEAVGTLQDQQDIYMESTAAHLQQLKTEAQKTYDILFDQNTVNGFADALTGALGIFNNFIDAVGGGGKAFTALGTMATNVFSKQIGDQLSGFIINKQQDKANKGIDDFKRDIVQEKASKGENISGANLDAQAEQLQKTWEVQKGLTQEEYNQLMVIQEQIGKNAEQLEYLKQYPQLAEEFDLNEEDALILYEEQLKIQKEILKGYAENITSSNTLLKNIQLETLSERNKNQYLKQITDLQKAGVFNEQQISELSQLNLSNENDRLRVEEIIKQAIVEQTQKLSEQETNVKNIKQATEGRKASEQGLTQELEHQNNLLGKRSDEIRGQGDLRQNVQTYVQALSAAVMLLQTISSVVSVLTDKTKTAEEKTKAIFSLLLINLPILLMNITSLKSGIITLITDLGKFKFAEEAATMTTTKLATALLALPITWVVVGLAALAGGFAIAGAAIDRTRENFAADTKELIENTNALKEEAKAHGELITQFEDLKEQYDAGEISKEDLWETTNQLIDAYDLEGARLAALTGDYDKFAQAIKNARDAELEEIEKSQKENFQRSGVQTADDAAKGWFDNIQKSGDTLKVSMYSDVDNITDSKDEKINQLYKKNFGTDSRQLKVDSENPTEVLNFYNQLLNYQKDLEEAGLETTAAYQHLVTTINQFGSGEGLQQLIQQQKDLADTTMQLSHLDEAIDEDDFNSKMSSLNNALMSILPDEEERHQAIISYVAGLNTDLANSFIIEDSVKQKFSDETAKALSEALSGKDDQTKAAILDLSVDWNDEKYKDNKEEIKKKVEELTTYVTGTSDGVYSIPWGLQSGLDETILKGKDINKQDWEEMTANVPNAEETLGTRQEFNNKSIGERISLMHELNEATRENALLSIEGYGEWEEAARSRHEEIDAQIKALNHQIEVEQKRVEAMESGTHSTSGNTKALEEQKQKVQELADQLQDLTGEKYEIEIELNTSLNNDINAMVDSMASDIITQTDTLIAAAESVGDAWTIAADEVGNFAAVFPELMDEANFEWLEDGSIQFTELGRQVLNETLENNQQIMNSNKEVVLDAIDNQIAQLDAEIEFRDKEIDAYEKFLNSSGDMTEASEQLERDLKNATSTYEEDLRSQGLINEENANNTSLDMATSWGNGVDDILKSLNDELGVLHENVANMFNENYGHQSLPGFSGTGHRSTNTYKAGSFGDPNAYNNYSKEQQAQIDAIKNAKEAAEAARDAANARRASLYDAQAKIRQGTDRANQATDRVQSGKAGKEDTSKSKSGGGKEKKEKERTPKDEKQYKDEFDRYWQLKKAIDAVDKALEKLEKRQQHLYGWELIKSLKQENELLEKQKACYEQLAAAQEQEAAELRGQLGTMGVMFDASGAIVNYAEATAAALAAYNEAIQQYNAGLIDETTLGVAEKAFENFKALLSRYDTLYYNEMKETQEKLEEIKDKEIENNLKAWETELKIKIDWNDLKKGWNKFIHDMREDFKSVFKDLRVDSKLNKKNFKQGKKNLDVDYKELADITAEIDKMMAGGESDMFHSISEAQEKLKELNEQLQKHATELQEEYKQAWDNYLEGIDQVADKLDMIHDKYEEINKELEYQQEIIQLLYGDESYDLNATLYQAQKETNLSTITSTQKEKEFWKARFEDSGANINDSSKWTEDQLKFYQNWQEAEQKLREATIKGVQLEQDIYRNEVEKYYSDYEKKLTGGKKLEDAKLEWERLKENSDRYFDGAESLYHLNTLANKYDQAIANTTSIKQQKELNALKEKELGILEKEKELTDYDIKAANLRYEIALKQMALENAQNSKTNMKLTRNEQGNWSYQYVADEEDVLNKKQELLDTWQQLHELANNAYQENIDRLFEINETYIEKSKEYAIMAMSQDEEVQQRAIQLQSELDEWYTQQTEQITDDNEKYKRDGATATAGIIKASKEDILTKTQSVSEEEKALADDVKNTSVTDFEELGKKGKEVLENTKKEWKSTAEHMIKVFSTDSGSVKKMVEDATEKMDEARKKYQQGIDDLAEAAGRNFGEEGITGDINKATQATENLEEQTEKMCSNGENYIESLRRTVEYLEEAWNNVRNAIEAAISTIEEYMQKQREANALAAESAATTGASSNFNPAEAQANNHNPNTNGSNGSSSNGTNTSSEDKKRQGGGTAYLMERASGGYTGEWAGSASGQGIPAILHEKEFVLNKQDTANFLSGINTIRDLASINGSIEKSIMQAVLNTASQLGNIKSVSSFSSGSASTETVSNTFNITAEFPNANDVSEIREAILSLPNIASQYINSNLL